MLKHEEMIENVHRRIAQYEAEKKMKHSKLKKIISAIKPTEKNEAVKTNEDGYAEVVSGTETVNSSRRVMRMVSTMAAGAILVTGIGTTGFLLHKNKSPNHGLPEEEITCTQATETTCPLDTDPGSVSPFVDFNQIYFGISVINVYDTSDYSDETYSKLAVFLNNFNWGEGSEIGEGAIPDFDNYEGKGYSIGWQKGDMYYYLYVLENGKAYYLEKKCFQNGGSFDYPTFESLVYDIDYEAFDKEVQDILSRDIPDTGEYLSKRQKKYLSQGEFMNGMVERYEGFDSEEVIPEDHKSFEGLPQR